jgi:hypothetical protein
MLEGVEEKLSLLDGLVQISMKVVTCMKKTNTTPENCLSILL